MTEAYEAFVAQITEAFARVDFPEAIRAMDRYFGEATYSLKTLFRDEQRRILDTVLDATLAEDEASYRQIYDRQAPLMRFVRDLHVPLPQAFQTAAAFITNTDLRRALAAATLDRDRIQALLADAETWHVDLDTPGLSYMLRRRAERLAEQLQADPEDLATADRAAGCRGSRAVASLRHRLLARAECLLRSLADAVPRFLPPGAARRRARAGLGDRISSRSGRVSAWK